MQVPYLRSVMKGTVAKKYKASQSSVNERLSLIDRGGNGSGGEAAPRGWIVGRIDS